MLDMRGGSRIARSPSAFNLLPDTTTRAERLVAPEHGIPNLLPDRGRRPSTCSSPCQTPVNLLGVCRENTHQNGSIIRGRGQWPIGPRMNKARYEYMQ
ncbi:hypothetical protein CGRA01v4_03792 [Colletotrichum graminicola]|nr:hypothetical protein CGRA01v4_03792 [Colletotrichum graminicola]